MTEHPTTGDPAETTEALILRRSLLGGLGLAAIGGLTAGALGLSGNAAAPRAAATPRAATATLTHDPTHAVAAAGSPSATPPVDPDVEAEAKVEAFPPKADGSRRQ